ncbi:hypothetical protein ACS0TY_009766 [Phlomoides rotata]
MANLRSKERFTFLFGIQEPKSLLKSYLEFQPSDRAEIWTARSTLMEVHYVWWRLDLELCSVRYRHGAEGLFLDDSLACSQRLGLEISNIQNSRRLLNGVSPIESIELYILLNNHMFFLVLYTFFPESDHVQKYSTNMGLLQCPHNGLGVTHHHSKNLESDETVECAVCLCRIDEGDEMRELRCDHLFHKVCLDRWLGYGQGTCPLCRGNVKPRQLTAELIQELVVFNFSATRSRDDRDTWWLR